ncbi:MAG: polysaccharide deacetylase family protein [Armatimonadetes bacterium]|nr:polysaccharide deacetylase family protein [Armatimonadota bacterium]MDE2205229.1 polysaccharide deacetylase family protein [Armatimonadota bacterium]
MRFRITLEFCWSTAAVAAILAPSASAAHGRRAAKAQKPATGMIPIIMYHAIGGPAEFAGGRRYDIHGLNIAPQTFRHQLELMRNAGWIPINVSELLKRGPWAPSGRQPVALTFDDARGSQFHTLPNGSIDPNCAVGILLAFHRRHPDWPLRATFYILPDSPWNGVPFDQDREGGWKLRFLIRHGFELGNHTTSHRPLNTLDGRTIQWELANAVSYIHREVGPYAVRSLALPYGIPPKPAYRATLFTGRYRGATYNQRLVLLAGGGPSPLPTDPRFVFGAIPRVVPAPGVVEQWTRKLRHAWNNIAIGRGDAGAGPRSHE